MSIKAFRGGASMQSPWSEVESAVQLALSHKELRFEFAMSAAGGGYTAVEVLITSESFEELAKKMLLALLDPCGGGRSPVERLRFSVRDFSIAVENDLRHIGD